MEQAIFDFLSLDRKDQIQRLYTKGDFIVAIRYYGYKINLYLLDGFYVEVFYNHKLDCIEKIDRLDFNHSRMKFYQDQISIESVVSSQYSAPSRGPSGQDNLNCDSCD